MTLETSLGPGKEFDRIRAMAERWRERAHGLGDDCAFLEAGGQRLAISIDLSIEGVHFRREWMKPAEIGYRAAAAAFSDLAAVAAQPMALLLSIGVPAAPGEDVLLALADGVGAAAADAGALIVGGDLSSSERLVVDCCVIGRADHEVRRRGARPGDILVVTGALGGPLAALTAWQAGRTPAAEARERFVHPAQRHDAARWLAARGARAMIDVSDGLGADLGHLLAAGGVGARIEVERIPVLAAARASAADLGEPAWRFAARSGEEYELLAALPPEVSDADLAEAPVPLARIGVVEAEPGARGLEQGRGVALPGGWDHFGAA